ncbi:MAG TPA: SDR family oxidoreductase [Gemmatimonadales bacterium]|nr:SDR family oxidoreductase [Gemmatimonadales bacterium]
MTLHGKVVLVTGGSSGIGRAIALAVARAGADVAITYRGNAEGAEATAAEIRAAGRRAEVLRADVSQEADVADLARAMEERFGRVDAWINNAGADILTREGATLGRLEKLDLVLAVDLRGTILASWAAVDLMRTQGGGVIINMAWDHIAVGMKGENPILYSAAKGGITSFSKSLAREVAPLIRVNILAPGFIDTAFGQEASAGWRREVEDRTPLARWGVPEDVAAAAVFLASDQAAFLTGQLLMVNGGVVM